MSEYTPTTEQIRATDADGESEGTPEDYAEFDRWLAAHDAEVRASVVPEIGMPCADTNPHPAHAWQMSATGWCLCAGVAVEEPEWEPSAQDLLDAIYDPDEDSENDSVRYGYILEQLERLRGKR